MAKQESWIHHSCAVKGCTEGYVTIDGNEKLRRSICSQSGEKILSSEGLRVQDCCPEDPGFGGRFKKPVKFCVNHQECVENEENKDGNEMTVRKSSRKRKLPLYLKEYESLYSDESIERIIVTDEEVKSCKDKSKLNKFYKTTAGMLFVIRPCGVIVGFAEMYSHESLTQVFLLLRKMFFMNDSCKKRIKYLGYDRCCELKPFLRRLVKENVAGSEEMLNDVQFLVDIFHVLKHTKPSCMPLNNNPLCEFHPKLDKFSEIHGCNTESCEQAFKKLNRFKYSTRHMTRHKRVVYFCLINCDHNESIDNKTV
ncbi:unnamed protein product [Mytilus edulis]|uniref:Uncharacterized protein n=1 Tax=Mytilus edulis TaxID=6550 RepID=A0A8S3S921_MYTED|nr:unnamed protein product [Mytilus edulis]